MPFVIIGFAGLPAFLFLKPASIGKGRIVVLDYYFNNEYKKDTKGHLIRFHYTWEDTANTGFSVFGNIFRQSGATIESLRTAPARAYLEQAGIYIYRKRACRTRSGRLVIAAVKKGIPADRKLNL